MDIRNTLDNMSRWRWDDTFEELERMRQEIEKLYQYPEIKQLRRSSAGIFPAINITEEKDAYYIRAELPGIKGDDLDISLANNAVTISGERKSDPEDEKSRYHRREREVGTFSRKITLPTQIDESKVDAKCGNGILTIVLPKAESAKPKKIAIAAI